MDSQLLSYSQNYLATILNLNLLLITASGIILYKYSHGKICANILLLVSILASIVAISFVVYSYQELFEYLLGYDPNVISNFKKPFKILNWVFALNIISLVATGLALIVIYLWRQINE